MKLDWTVQPEPYPKPVW